MNDLGIPVVVEPRSRSTNRLALVEAPLKIRPLLKDYLPVFVNYLSDKIPPRENLTEEGLTA